MQIQSSSEGSLATVALEGLVDTRGSQEFERHVVDLFNKGARSLIIDLSKVDLITSAGIRVLVMMAQRLQRAGGGLVLCALSPKVRSVFDISGLLVQFRIAETRAEAGSLLGSLPGVPQAAPPATSRLTRLICRILEDDDAPAPAASGARASRPSALTASILELLRRTSNGSGPAARG